MNEIEKARKLQNDCVKLHMIPPILGILKIEKINAEKEIIESSIRKSNSYVRNAYSVMAMILTGAANVSTDQLPPGYTSTTVGVKTVPGTVQRYLSNSILGGTQFIRVGSIGTPDIMDDFKLIQEITTLTPDSMTYNGQLIDKKLTMELKRNFVNTSPTPITVMETGVFNDNSSSSNSFMFLRDVFEPVTLNRFEGITITYILELIYP